MIAPNVMISCCLLHNRAWRRKTRVCFGFVLLGQWPSELLETHPHKVQKKKANTSKHVYASATVVADLQADHGVDMHQDFSSTAAHSLTRKDTLHYSWPPLCRIVPQFHFLACQRACERLISALSVTSVSPVCLSDRSSSSWCFKHSPSPPLIHLTGRTRSVNS